MLLWLLGCGTEAGLGKVEEAAMPSPYEAPERGELPDPLTVEEIEEDGNMLRILAYIVVEKDSQKRIVIGKGAEKIREIATHARKDLESIFGRKIFLTLRAKADPRWKKNRKLVNHLLS